MQTVNGRSVRTCGAPGVITWSRRTVLMQMEWPEKMYGRRVEDDGEIEEKGLHRRRQRR